MSSFTRMFERRTSLMFVSILLIVIVVVGSLGYGIGKFSTTPEKTTTTITSTTTTTAQGALIYVTITERKTVTSTVLPHTLPLPAGSTAVIRSFPLLDRRVLATLSIDKPTYRQGETVHTKATLTNVSADYLSLELSPSLVKIENSSKQTVWMHPESELTVIFGPPPTYDFDLSPGETVTLDHMTMDWNMTGLHVVSALPGLSVRYDDHPVPAGQYTLVWPASIRSGDKFDVIYEKINFTITAK